MHEKSTLRRDLESWRGVGFTEQEAAKFDITKLMGVPCMISIIHRPGKNDPSKTYVEISTISKMPKGLQCPEQINPSRVLSFENWNQELYDSLSDFLKNKIASSEEFKIMNSGTINAEEVIAPQLKESDLPF